MQAPSLRRFSSYLWRDWVRPVGLPFLLIAAAKSALADVNPVPTGSMQPTVLTGDCVFVDKLAYDLKVPFTTTHLARWANPARGDIVVCFSPTDGTRLLKRIAAVPGDTIEMRQETLLLNGRPLAYAALDAAPATGSGLAHLHLPPEERDAALFAREQLGAHSHTVMILPRRPALRSFGPVTVPAGAYFMLGDNRDNSEDSRYFGFVARDQIVGRARAVAVSADLHRWLLPRFDRFFTALD
jgi:signal peptidase I